MKIDQILQQASSNYVVASAPEFHLLSSDKCFDYLHTILERAIARGSYPVVEGKSLILIELLPFTSECFGQLMGKLSWAIVSPDDSHKIARVVISEAKQHVLSHLTVRLDTRHLWFVQALEHSGFYLVDTQVNLARSLPLETDCLIDRQFEISPFETQDLDWIQHISANVFRLSRFYADPNLSAKSADELHRRWIANDCNGRADVVLIARRNKQILGYIACIYHPGDPILKLPPRSEIDLIAVAPEAHGQGVGTALVWAALLHYNDQAQSMIVETQGNNYPAINLYAKCGFRFELLAATFHWSGGNDS